MASGPTACRPCHCLPTSLLCADEPPAATPAAPAPPCLEGEGSCETAQDFKDLRTFSSAVDASLQAPLARAEKARKVFLRRANDYQYATIQDQSQLLSDSYGPNGPMLPGGSYLYELRRWSDAVHLLHRACGRSEGCHKLLGFLQSHPEADAHSNGLPGKAGSKVFAELRQACEVGRTRAPVPNDEPAWCDDATGLCEQKSCRKWWRAAHGGKLQPKPWVDDRQDYDDLRDACGWVTEEKRQPGEVEEYQRMLEREQARRKEQFCRPRWVEGYCEGSAEKKRYAECVLQTGQRCERGLVLPGTEQDETSNWKEPLQEPPVTMGGMGDMGAGIWLLGPAPARRGPCRGRQAALGIALFL